MMDIRKEFAEENIQDLFETHEEVNNDLELEDEAVIENDEEIIEEYVDDNVNNFDTLEKEIVGMFDEEVYEGEFYENDEDGDYVEEYEEDEYEIDEDEVIMDDVIYDAKGNPINKQVDGEMKVAYVPLEDILIPPRGKLFVDDLSDLEESIQFWGLVEPVHLVPYKDNKYFLLHGYRRYLAYRNLGYEVIPALIDSTRPKQVIRYLEVVANNVRRYNFIEMMKIGEFIEERQKSFSHDTIENILGLPPGHYLKAKYIEAAKEQFPDIYKKVLNGKMAIDQAFKKIEKELNKEEQELSPLDVLNRDGLPNHDDYGEVEEEIHVQKVGERHPLDPALRKYVEARDMHTCQACGMGLGEPDLSAIFHVHHIIPVKHNGPDKKGNLLLLCPNCHGYVHAYDEGKFKPSKELVEEYDTIYNIILLGNIVKRGLPADYNGEAYDFYVERAKQYWVREEV